VTRFREKILASSGCATHKSSAPIDRIDDLTAFRALCAAWVFAYHIDLQLLRPAASVVGPLLERGYLGVDGFFILSGLVLALAHARLGLRRQELLGFWSKRLARVYPVHLAMIGLLAILLGIGALAGVAPREPDRFGLLELARSLVLVQAWRFSDRLAWNYPSWSISTEWAGYLLFPVVWIGVRRLPGRVLSVLPPCMGAGLLAVAWHSDWRLNLTYAGALGRYFPEFIAGMAIARLVERWPDALPGRPLGIAAAALTVLAGLWAGDAVVVAGLWLVLWGMLLAARQRRPPLLGGIPGLLVLGTISYAFYMSFAPVEMVEAFAWRRIGAEPAAHPLLYLGLTASMTLALGLLAWRYVERPGRSAVIGWLSPVRRDLASVAPGG